MKKTTCLFFILQASIVFLMIADLLPQSCAYLVLSILILSLFVLNKLEFLKLFIYSIPFFVVMPPNFLSDSMSIWRVIVLIWFLKIVVEYFDLRNVFMQHLKSPGELFVVMKERLEKYYEFLRAANYYKLLVLVLIFGAICVFSLVFAVSIGVGIKKIIFLSSSIMLFSIVMYSVKSREDWLSVLRSVFLSALAIMVVGYSQFFLTFFWTLSDFWGFWYTYIIRAFYGERMMVLLSYSNTWFSYYGNDNLSPTLRMFSVMPDSHSFAMLMILFSPIAIFYSATSQKKNKKILFIFLLSLFFLAIFLSGSRGAWASWVVAVFFSLSVYLLRKKIAKFRFVSIDRIPVHKKHYKSVIVSLALFVVLFPVSAAVLQKNQEAQMMMEGRALNGEKRLALLQRTWSIYDLSETSNKGRLQIWQDSVNSIIRNPIAGIGIGNFPVALGENLATSKMGASAHNIYLDVAVEVGILGLIVFVLIILEIMKKLFIMSNVLKRYSLRLLSASFLVYFIWIMAYGLFDVVILNDKVLMFFVILLAILYKIDELDRQKTL